MSPDGHTGSEHLGLHARLAVLRRRKWIFLLAVVVVPAAALAYSFHQPAKYRASADVLLGRQSTLSNLTGVPDLSSVSDPQRIVDTEVALAREPQVTARVIGTLKIKDRTAEDLLAQSSVSAQADTNLLEISITDRNRSLAVKLVNAYADQFALFVLQHDTTALRAALTKVRERLASLGGDRNSQAYANLADSEQQLETALALQTGNATVVRTATDAGQVQPQPVRDGALGLVLGIVLGIGLVFLRESLDTRVRSAEEVGAILHLPLLARIPRPPRRLRGRHRLVTLSASRSPAAEVFRVLRTNLEFVNLDGRAKTIMVTSATEEEGKSTTAANLAVSLAKAGKSVVLVDLDLRKPFVHRFFELDMSPGLTDVALGHEGLGAAIVRLAIVNDESIVARSREPNVRVLRPASEDSVDEGDGDGWFSEGSPDPWRLSGGATRQTGGTLSILASGPIPPDPGEFVGSRLVKAILDEVADHADFVIVDSPPLLSVSDTLTLSAYVDGIVVVARIDLLRRRTLAELHRVLESCRAERLGFVVTDANGHDDYAYGYRAYGAQPSRSSTPRDRAGPCSSR